MYKYADDCTLFEICNYDSVSILQQSANIVSDWSVRNDMKINSTKTKEMLICFCKDSDHCRTIPNINVDGNDIERVTTCKILGVTISSNLTWNAHVDNISKAGKRYLLYQLKRAGIPQGDLLTVVLSVIRPVMEYACPAWHINITQYLYDSIEMVQKRAIRSIFPGNNYEETKLPTPAARRNSFAETISKKCEQKATSCTGSFPTPDKCHIV